MISSCFLGKSNVDRKKKQAENISVDEGTRIRHRELSRSLSKVALMIKWKNLSYSYFYGFFHLEYDKHGIRRAMVLFVSL